MIIYCQVCGAEIEIDFVSRDSVCPECNAYLHSCVQCEFYDLYAHNQCREPSAEYVGDKEGPNFCEYFKPKVKPPPGGKQKVDPDELLKKLFKNGGK